MAPVLDSPPLQPQLNLLNHDEELEDLHEETDEIDLPEEDGVPLDSAWHRNCINLMTDSLIYHWRDRRDYCVGGNMCIYYSAEQAQRREFIGPDVFVVNGNVNIEPLRRVWAIWKENGRGLDVAVELLSRKTARYDRTAKKDIYEQRLKTPEYVCYDPDRNRLEGWRLDSNGRYQSIALAKNGRFWSERAGLWIGTWDGIYNEVRAKWLRWFDSAGNVCLLQAEEEARLRLDEKRRADTEARLRLDEKRRADTEARLRADEKRRADIEARLHADEKRRADAEARRADDAEAEIKRLRALLAQKSL